MRNAPLSRRKLLVETRLIVSEVAIGQVELLCSLGMLLCYPGLLILLPPHLLQLLQNRVITT